jgi:KUP system potassium uptake protein
VFLNATGETTPLALRYNVEHNHVLHERVVVVTVSTAGVPHVAPEERLEVDDLVFSDDGIFLVRGTFGFQDKAHVPPLLRQARERGADLDVDGATYFLSRITIEPGRGGAMAMWRKRLFTAMSRNAASPVAFFGLPEDRVISLGGSIEL